VSGKSIASRPTEENEENKLCYARFDLINRDLALERAQQWRIDVAVKFSEKFRFNIHPRCVLACDTLACALSVEVNPQGLAGLDVRDLDLSYYLLESLTSSSAAFQEFMRQHWDQVLHSAFASRVQPWIPSWNRSSSSLNQRATET
jgi:hypothetical protein